MPSAKLDEIITSLSNTSGSFDDYTKRVTSIIDALKKCKELEKTLDSMTQTNKKLNDEKLAAVKKFKDCDDVRNKTDYVKIKQDYEDAISNKESQVLALKDENRKLTSDLKDIKSSSVEMVSVSKDDSKNITLVPSNFKQKCKTPAGQKEMTDLAKKYINMETSDPKIADHYKKIGEYMLEQCYVNIPKNSPKTGGKSRKLRKSHKSTRTRRVHR